MPARVRVNRQVPLRGRGDPGDVATRLPSARELRTLLTRAGRAVLDEHGIAKGELSITLLDDEAIAGLNRHWLGHDRPTDVIAFALQDEGAPPLGDVYIGVPQAMRQAGEHGASVREELVRLTVHGTLHVLGYDHPEGEERVRGKMWQLQEMLTRRVMESSPA